MITAQDIREKTFEKAKFGGYDMASVDDFLEELADDITASQKENAVLKSKMKMLCDKIEEYRANEEAINTAILSAQKMAVQIEADARARASAMLADADRQAKAQIGSITEQAEAEEKRLAVAKETAASFLDAMRNVCNNELKKLETIRSNMIPDLPVEEPTVEAAPVAPQSQPVEETVRSIENSVSRIKPEPAMQFDLSRLMDEPAKAKSQSGFDFGSTQPFSL